MAKDIIGIKLADNSLYPILETGKRAKKRLVLEPAKPDQKEVHIDIYSAEEGTQSPDNYIGTITIDLPEDEEIKEIELIIGLDEDGHLEATARDLHSDNQQSLTITIADSMGEDSLGDFSMVEEPFDSFDSGQETLSHSEEENSQSYVWDDAEEEAEEDFSSQDSWSEMSSREQELLQEDFSSEYKQDAEKPTETAASFTRYGNYPAEEKKKSIVPFILGTIIGLILGAVALFVLYPLFNPTDTAAGKKPDATQMPSPAYSAVPSIMPTPAKTDIATEDNNKEAQEEPVTSIIYTPGWGDTLWDLAKSFYNNPWLYPDIAKENNIKNPDLIYAGKPLKIPDIKKAK